MTYEEAMQKISSLLRFGMKPGLERIEKLLALLGNPQNKLRFVHVAGTNGKGSTLSLIHICEVYHAAVFLYSRVGCLIYEV